MNAGIIISISGNYLSIYKCTITEEITEMGPKAGQTQRIKWKSEDGRKQNSLE